MSGAAARLARLVREPLVQFAMLGFALFLAGSAYQARTDIYHIEVTPAKTAQLARGYALQFGAPPDPATLTALVRRDVQDEILVRQALAMKLDRDDEIIRRRLVQKMQFLMQDLHGPAEPTDSQLAAYHNAHPDKYGAPARASFSHVYFSPEHGDAAAKARAERVLASLPDHLTRAPDRGDSFPDLYDFAAYDPEQATRLFGLTPFAEAVFSAPVRHWAGPFRSGYGWHLLYVADRRAGERPPLTAVKEKVRGDYLQSAQEAANKAAFDTLARRFTVVRDGRRIAP